MTSFLRKALLAGAVSLAAFSAAPAASGTLQVDPVRLEITTQRRTATVTIRNREQVPVTIRAYPLEWTQTGGEDRYEPSSAIIISPPIFTIPAGGTQIIRAGLRNAAAGGRAYRLMIEEVPEANPGGGIQVALRLNLPLFAHLPAGAASDLSWSAWRGADGQWVVEAANRGRGPFRVEAPAAAAATGLRIPTDRNFGVVLPGASRRWTIGSAAVADQARFDSIRRGLANGEAGAQAVRR